MRTRNPPALPRPLIWLLFAALLAALCSFVAATDTGSGSTDSGSAVTYTTSGTWVPVSTATDADGVTTKTYGMDTDGDTTNGYEITLVCQGNTWTYSFSVADENAKYYVYEVLNNVSDEDVSSKWTLTDEDGTPISSITIENGADAILYNTEDGYGLPDYGSLSLTKALVDSSGNTVSDTETSFAFDVTLTYTPTGTGTDITPLLTGAQSYGDVTFTWETATDATTNVTTYTATARVSLKAGETVNLTDIPEGVTWKITEVTEGYTRTWSVDSTSSTGESVTGTIAEDTATAVTCANTKTEEPTPTPEEYGSIVIGKTVLDEDDTTAFSFRAVFGGLTAGGTYSYTVYDASGTEVADADGSTTRTYTALADGSAVVDFTLTNGQYAVFSGLPVGATYQVIESAADGYTASYALSNFTSVASSKGENYTANADLTTGKETLDSGEANKDTANSVHVQFTNTKPTPEPAGSVISVSVTKTWSDAASVDHTGDAVTISLYRAETQAEADSGQGDLVGSVTLDGVTDELETTAWQYTFTELERYVDDSSSDAWVYYVQETTTVKGYSATIDPKTGTDGDMTFSVYNIKDARLPDSGGSGTTPYVLIGLSLMAAAAAVYGCKRHSAGRRQKR